MKPFHQGKQTLRLVCRDSLDYPIHLQDAVEIIFVLEGESVALYEKKRISLSSGDLFVAFPGRIHGFTESRGIRAYVFIIPRELVSSLMGMDPEGKFPRNPSPALSVEEREELSLIMNLAFKNWAPGTKPLREGYTAVLLSKILPLLSLQEEERVSSSALALVMRYINEHYKESLSRRSIADAVGYHESYLSHLFCENLGKSLSDYVLSLRLADAADLLENTRESISTIALSLGFGSIRSFNRAFLKETGLSPSAYRQRKGEEKK